ncbi:MAG: hypothetical protein QM368_04605 [Bacillota bacterium]|jgi:hypothetical protein|nr:hypothetical protein [Bacillota bacterium]HHU29696.1 hypothetical protein [Bacillota bacterium]
MEKPKFSEKNIITTFERPKEFQEEEVVGEYPIDLTSLLWLKDEVTGGAMYSECHWIWGKRIPGIFTEWKSHSHDFDEVLCFIGSNKDDPTDLGAELEITIDGKQYTINKTCMIYIPRGVSHLPLKYIRIDRPFIFATHGNGQYQYQYQYQTEED